jgi:hypothetical protein
MKPSAVSALALCALSALCPDTSQAQTAQALPWIGVVDVRSYDAPEQARAVSSVIRQDLGGAATAGFQLDSLFAELACSAGPDSACLDRIANRLQTELFVWGYARRVAPGQVMFELHLFARGEPERYTELTLSDVLTDPSNAPLRRSVHTALTGLVTRGGAATIRLRAGNSSGQVLLDGHPATDLRNGQAVMSLRAGEHRIEVRLPDHLAAERTLFVQPGSVTDLLLEPPPSASTDSEPGTSVNWRKTGGLIALGAGAVFTGLGVWSTTQVKAINDDQGFQEYRMSVAATGDVCDAANAGLVASSSSAASPSRVSDLCASGTRYERLGIVFYGSALVSVGAGIYLLATSPSGPPARSPQAWQLVPSFGKEGGRLEARVRF